jgi:hypothetical protein
MQAQIVNLEVVLKLLPRQQARPRKLPYQDSVMLLSVFFSSQEFYIEKIHHIYNPT